MRNIESNIQQACVRYFRLKYPKYLCFSVPNGGSRSAITGAILKAEGAMAGVSDLVIVADGRVAFVEMKTGKGRQQDTQKIFQGNVERLGHPYFICRSLDEFMMVTEDFLR